MKRLAPLLALVLLAALLGGRPAAAQTGPGTTATVAPERPYFSRVTCDTPTDVTRYGAPWKSITCYGKFVDPAGPSDGRTIEFDSDTIGIDTTTQTNESGGFYRQMEFPAYEWGTIFIRGFAFDGRVTQPGEYFVPETR